MFSYFFLSSQKSIAFFLQKRKAVNDDSFGYVPCSFFADANNHMSNLEYTTHSAKVGGIFSPIKKFTIGLQYDTIKDTPKEYYGPELLSFFGSAKVKTKTNSLTAVISWNVKEDGFTETIASCYGWGKLKTLRTVSSVGRDVQIYGLPLLLLMED